MNIFITGASGFIGSHLKEYLEKHHNNVLFTPSSKELDLSDEYAVDRYILENKIDIIIHAANRGGGRDGGASRGRGDGDAAQSRESEKASNQGGAQTSKAPIICY